jgi:hypothetical protein
MALIHPVCVLLAEGTLIVNVNSVPRSLNWRLLELRWVCVFRLVDGGIVPVTIVRTATVGSMIAKVASKAIKKRQPAAKLSRLPFSGRTDCRREESVTPSKASELNIVIQVELVRMRTQLHGVDFVCGLVFDPHINDILGKDVTFEQEGVVFGQGCQGRI